WGGDESGKRRVSAGGVATKDGQVKQTQSTVIPMPRYTLCHARFIYEAGLTFTLFNGCLY
ncbi:MAG: hypothetical protein OQL17_10710, partial [Sedimenticola sp.]|nr:hypothetical protein [Sedimenticola sp.]